MRPPVELTDFDEIRLCIRGMDVRVFESDVVAGPAFVLIHGFGVSSRYFGPLAKELSQHGRVLVLDLPGFGKTQDPDEAPTIRDFADVVNDTILELAVAHPVLIGHSMGSQVAVEALVRAPGLARGAMLAAPVVNDRERRGGLLLWRFAQSAVKESPASAWASVRGFIRSGPRWLIRDFGRMLDYRIEDHLGQTDAPLTIVGATGDRIAPPEWCHRLASVRAGTDVVIVEGAAHEMIHTAAPEVAQIALELTQRGLDTAIPTDGRTALSVDGRTAPSIDGRVALGEERAKRVSRLPAEERGLDTSIPIAGRVALGEERAKRVSRLPAEERGLDTSQLVPRGDYSTNEDHEGQYSTNEDPDGDYSTTGNPDGDYSTTGNPDGQYSTTVNPDGHSSTSGNSGRARRPRPSPGLPPCGD